MLILFMSTVHGCCFLSLSFKQANCSCFAKEDIFRLIFVYISSKYVCAWYDKIMIAAS